MVDLSIVTLVYQRVYHQPAGIWHAMNFGGLLFNSMAEILQDRMRPTELKKTWRGCRGRMFGNIKRDLGMSENGVYSQL